MTFPQELRAYEQEFADQGYPSEPLWLSEFGWPASASVPTDAQASAAFYPSYPAQKADVEKAYSELLKLPFVQAAFWFNLRDYTPGVPNPDPPFFAHYGLLTYQGVYKPAAYVYRRLARAHPDR